MPSRNPGENPALLPIYLHKMIHCVNKSFICIYVKFTFTKDWMCALDHSHQGNKINDARTQHTHTHTHTHTHIL